MADLNCDVVVRSLKLKMLKSLVSFDGVLNIPCRRAASRGIVRVGRRLRRSPCLGPQQIQHTLRRRSYNMLNAFWIVSRLKR